MKTKGRDSKEGELKATALEKVSFPSLRYGQFLEDICLLGVRTAKEVEFLF